MHMHNAAMTFRCASAFVQMSVQSFRVSCLQSGALLRQYQSARDTERVLHGLSV